MYKFIGILIFLLFLSFNSNAQEDYYYEDFVYVEEIKSVSFKSSGDADGVPIVKLNGNSRLYLNFDDLDARDKRYTYKIIHCDRNWNPSEIDEMEYLDGFNGEEITESYHSMQTKVDYVHYSLTLPNEYLKWTISGNYLLIVSDEDDLPIITKRFLVVDPQLSVYAEFVPAKKIAQLKTHQSLKIELNFEDFYIRDPLNEITVSVLQNFRWFDAIEDVKPKNVVGSQLIFDAFDPFKFAGLKEFRNFDIRSLAYTTRYVYSINATSRRIDVQLEKDKKRTYTNFISEADINGNFIIGNQDNRNGVRAAEYVNVAFSLDAPLPFDKHDVYLIGGFSDWQIYESNLMEYDLASQLYFGNVLLKQGFYDYYYALVDDEGTIDLETIEGNWYETDNTYYILVYLREFGSYYDKLVAMYTVR